MSYIETIILNCLKQLNGERTIYSIYHLLKGKKSSQTIQDAHLFELTKYFGVFPRISREELVEAVGSASKHNWITSSSENQHYILTEKGDSQLLNLKKEGLELLYLNGWKYHQTDIQLWKKLSLLVQVISNLNRSETHYIPIQKDKQILNWLKAFLKKHQTSRNTLGSELFSELVDCLKTGNVNPTVLTLRLTGYNKIGLTPQQAAEKLKMDDTRYQLEFLNILHYFIRQAAPPSTRYPLLSSIIDRPGHRDVLTQSTHKTFELLNQGFSIEAASKFRHLKTSTIEDHIVEIALNIDDFSIDKYIEKQKQQRILAAARRADSKQLKQIRSLINWANYFEIRLVLAKYGVKQWN